MVLKALIVLVGCMGSLALAAPNITPKMALKCEFSPMLVEGVTFSPIPSQPLSHPFADNLITDNLALLP
jgi:hypothetical protein